MSRSLSIECERVEQPAAIDVLEGRTWASLRIFAASRSVTRLWDRATESERSAVYVPAFPLAWWLVVNWWPLLNEATPRDEVPPADRLLLQDEESWIQRHCLRAAEAGLLLPRACLFSDGRSLCVQWTADDVDAYPNMPGQFVDSGVVRVSPSEAEVGLREFVSTVLGWIQDLDDPRVTRFKENWNAIVSADVAERAFCRAAGRMGLDPYGSSQWNESLVRLLESEIGTDSERPLIDDLLYAATARDAADLWAWASTVESQLNLGKPSRPPTVREPEATRPFQMGYRAARKARAEAQIGTTDPIRDLRPVTGAMGLSGITLQERNHLPSSRVRAVVGWRNGNEPTVAGPLPPRKQSQRFLAARGIYHAAFTCDNGARLITHAHTWDQQAARAFAAELLAPRTALTSRWDPERPPEDRQQLIKELAQEFFVDESVIRLQLKNAGIDVDVEID